MAKTKKCDKQKCNELHCDRSRERIHNFLDSELGMVTIFWVAVYEEGQNFLGCLLQNFSGPSPVKNDWSPSSF